MIHTGIYVRTFPQLCIHLGFTGSPFSWLGSGFGFGVEPLAFAKFKSQGCAGVGSCFHLFGGHLGTLFGATAKFRPAQIVAASLGRAGFRQEGWGDVLAPLSGASLTLNEAVTHQRRLCPKLVLEWHEGILRWQFYRGLLESTNMSGRSFLPIVLDHVWVTEINSHIQHLGSTWRKTMLVPFLWGGDFFGLQVST